MSAPIGIFYGTTTYGTQIVAEKLQNAFGTALAEIHNIGRTTADRLCAYPFLILGTSTWGDGDLQPAWNEFLPTLETLDLRGRSAAVYGLGDQETYPDTFVSGLGLLYDAVLRTGADASAGWWPADGYRFTNSYAFRDGRFVGLVIDKFNQAPLTNTRVVRWSTQLREAWKL